MAEGSGLMRSFPVPSHVIPSLRIATEAFIEQRRVECQRCVDAITREPVLMRHPTVLRLFDLAKEGGARPPPLHAIHPMPATSTSPNQASSSLLVGVEGEERGSVASSPSAVALTSQALDPLRGTYALPGFGRSQSQNTGMMSTQSSVVRRSRLDRFTQEDLETVQLGSVLGRGTFGTVYQGFLLTSDGPLIVAVKELCLSAETSPETLQSIQNELSILCNTQHKNIIRFLGSVYLPEMYRLRVFTEYLECGTISTMVKRFGAMPLLAIQKYMTQILMGLSHLHSLNIVHRDLKGDNILLNKRGKVRLADFGCSDTLAQQVEIRMQADPTPCEAGEGGEAASRPPSGSSGADNSAEAGEGRPSSKTATVAFPIGTPLWMAPEVIHGELSEAGKKASPAAADIWAVGCIGIEMLDRPIWSFGDVHTHPFAVMYHIARSTSPPDGLLSEEELRNSFQGSGTESDAEKLEAFSIYRDFLVHCLELKPEDRWTAQQLLKHPFFHRTFSKHLRWAPPHPSMPVERD
ncbi:unnamed protein product [Phytomonas sp. EM1]|nr:unnamed protein product [Phytomonas sp. EM1]|eukprot:CCW65393.1 unnamed protein product [Phytomonas sp. isolate EM1]